MNTPPAFLQPFLWSYDISKMDISRDKKIIIKQILDFGTMSAVDWLRSAYSAEEISAVIEDTPRSDWSKKSLALWSLIYGVAPKHSLRVIQ